jgi:hypothetical protein
MLQVILVPSSISDEKKISGSKNLKSPFSFGDKTNGDVEIKERCSEHPQRFQG